MSKDGGPAFPDIRRLELCKSTDLTSAMREKVYFESSGMSLRDYFAAHFMGRAQILSESDGGWNFDTAAQCAYEMADAMLKARQ